MQVGREIIESFTGTMKKSWSKRSATSVCVKSWLMDAGIS